MTQDAKQLLKILIGAAWLDGKVQPEEQKRLRRIAEQKALLDDAELHPWLHGLRSVSVDECYQWIDEYLGKHPKPAAIQELLEEISGLIYSDGDVDSAEAQVLNQLQRKEAAAAADTNLHDTVTRAIQNLYRRWVSQ
ncbi:TerB family tellurite resistance protein [Altericista sp. CCNU0014]|uniref:tellurite resistance TerB family protein n=1 Tax=Altericista sp. CCNU0014 TaxID=3082949 RepID=UPI00384B3016